MGNGGTDGSGTFAAIVGDTLTVSHTIGPKAAGFGCLQASAKIGSTNGGTQYASQTASGQNASATAVYTVTGGHSGTIYMVAGIAKT
jgi:hypothetical protein